MHKSQVFLYLLASFIGGVFVGSFWFISVSWMLALIIGAMSVIAIAAYHKSTSKSKKAVLNKKIGILIGFLIISFIFGVFRFNSFNLESSILEEFSKNITGPIQLIGYVGGEPDISAGRTNFTFEARKVVVNDRAIEINEKVLVTTDTSERYNFGDQLAIAGTLKKPQNFSDFDYITYLKKDGIRMTVPFPKIYRNITDLDLGFLEKSKISIYRKIFLVKETFQEAVNRSIPDPNAAYINGILLGTRQNIPDDLKQAFNKTSTTHILAISGYNIMVISDVVLMILVLFVRRKVAFWISVVVIILFTILTGSSSSVVRAAIMGLVLLFASGYGRLYDVRNSVILTGAIMIYTNPFVLIFDVGFQLSFLAVLGLVYLYPLLDYKLRKIPKLGGLKEIILMTSSAQLIVAPLLVYYFKSLSLVSLPTNILILPFVPYAMLAGFVAGTSGMIFAPIGQLFGFIAWAISAYQIKVVEYLASFNYSSVSISIDWPIMLGIYLIIFIMLYGFNSKNSKVDNKEA